MSHKDFPAEAPRGVTARGAIPVLLATTLRHAWSLNIRAIKRFIPEQVKIRRLTFIIKNYDKHTLV